MENYRIIINLNQDKIFFETAATEEEADEIVESWLQNNPYNVSIYEQKNENEYCLKQRLTKTTRGLQRPIGFGRW